MSLTLFFALLAAIAGNIGQFFTISGLRAECEMWRRSYQARRLRDGRTP